MKAAVWTRFVCVSLFSFFFCCQCPLCKSFSRGVGGGGIILARYWFEYVSILLFVCLLLLFFTVCDCICLHSDSLAANSFVLIDWIDDGPRRVLPARPGASSRSWQANTATNFIPVKTQRKTPPADRCSFHHRRRSLEQLVKLLAETAAGGEAKKK